MKVDALIRWFMPKEGGFQELLAQDTENLLRATRLFADIARSESLEVRRVKVVQLKALEHEGDQLTRKIFEQLNSTFLTPLDREDIRAIASDLDDILDFLEGVAQRLVIFELRESPEALRMFADILVGMVEEIDRATALVWDLGNEPKIRVSMVRISDLENQADALFATVIANLFRTAEAKPVEMLKWKEVFEGLEDACDQCKDFTHVIGNVVIKNT